MTQGPQLLPQKARCWALCRGWAAGVMAVKLWFAWISRSRLEISWNALWSSCCPKRSGELTPHLLVASILVGAFVMDLVVDVCIMLHRWSSRTIWTSMLVLIFASALGHACPHMWAGDDLTRSDQSPVEIDCQIAVKKVCLAEDI